MPIHRVKSRARFQGSSKKTKHDDGAKPQYKPTRTMLDIVPRSRLPDDMVDEVLFKKKRVPSTEELGDLLKSNLSSSLATEKAYQERQKSQYSQPLPFRPHVEFVQEDDDDPPASLLRLAPLVYAHHEHHQVSLKEAAVDEGSHDAKGPSPSSLATTTVYAPLNGHRERETLPQASFSTPQANIRLPFRSHVEGESAADSCAIEDDDEDNAECLQSSAPILIRKGQSEFLRRVITLFAGRRRYREWNKGSHEQIKDQEESTTPLNSPPQPSVGSPCCSVTSDDALVSSGSIRPPPSRREPSHFTSGNARLNLPVSPPIIVPKSQRPHQPFHEGLSQPFIKPAPDHRLFGTYYVAPDIFTPEVVLRGVPGPSTRTPLTHPLSNEARFLDRTNTAWGKWYAKCPKPEDLPFASTYKGAQAPTDQEVWDMHAAAHARFRKAASPPKSEEDIKQRLDEEEHNRAERLRYHTGDCFAALTGHCYPWQGGLII